MTNTPDTSAAELREEILSIVHLFACQCMNTDDLEDVERKEHLTTDELMSLITAHTHQLIFPPPFTNEQIMDAGNVTDGQYMLGFNRCLEEITELNREDGLQQMFIKVMKRFWADEKTLRNIRRQEDKRNYYEQTR